jgi:hypothetical protein
MVFKPHKGHTRYGTPKTITGYEELFDDIMYYAERKLGDFKGTTSEDLRDFIKDYDKNDFITPHTLNELEDTSKWQNELSEKTFSKKAAIRKELRRPDKARLVDEAVTSKKVLSINKATYRQWARNPARYDLRGVDTQTHTYIREETKRRLKKHLDAGRQIRRRNGIFYYHTPHGARNALNGQWTRR